MAGTEEHSPQDSMESNFSFQWDEASQLYFHASSGFYHDPNAGWYYSSRDGLYYTFENGSYVLLESVESTESDACQSPRMVSDRSIQDEKSTKSEAYLSMGAFSDKDGHQCRAECLTSDVSENPPPPSEWLEETLINLYLAGYSNSEIVAEDSVRVLETDGPASEDCIKMLSDKSCSEELSSCSHDAAFEEIEEGEWVPEDMQDAPGQSGRETVEDISLDEENWRAQYGQVVKSEDEYLPAFSALDLWDWTMVTETMGKKKHQVARLIGRLARRSAKLHPSVPAGGGLLKTAAICDAHLDLVRVTSGQIYKLRTPSTRYLASLSTYDSANPTKDWGLPDLLVNMHSIAHANLGANHESELSTGVIMCEDSCTEKQKTRLYRDRAAERRTLHGGFGIGPGQRSSVNNDSSVGALGSDSADAEVAAAEAIEMSFGAGSYARRLLENMGWKEGTALGNNREGLIEPLQAVGNKGNAGLGWNQRNV